MKEKTWSLGGVLFGFVFFAAGSFFLSMMALKPILKVIESKSWQQIACQITHSEVVSRRDSDGGRTYFPDIKMSWTYGSREYEGGSYSFNEASSSGKASESQIVRQHPVGSNHPCWVNPKNPHEAVISRDMPGLVYFAVPFTAIFIIIGAVVMLASSGLLPNAWLPQFNSRHKPVTQESAGQQELKTQQGPKAKLIFGIFFAAIWNGITSIFLWEVIQSHSAGKPEWFLTFFIVPFVLVGLGAIGFVVYAFLALFNPRPSITLNEGHPKLGQKISLTWQFDRPTDRLQSLNISLIGEESATYQQGTSTRTDRHIFFEQPLHSGQMPSEIESGSVSVHIPENSMHSFDSGNNAIHWFIRLHGDIPKWPDVKLDFPVTVRPGES